MAGVEEAEGVVYSQTSPAPEEGELREEEASELLGNIPLTGSRGGLYGGALPKKEEPQAPMRVLDLQADTTEMADFTEPALPTRPYVSELPRSGAVGLLGRPGVERAKGRADCPQLLAGSKLDKPVALEPNIWVRIGRNPEARVRLDNSGVSRNQCRLKWDPLRRHVELHAESEGTMLNGKPIPVGHLNLEHADCIRIVGKGQVYEFVLDLRSTGLAFEDPVAKVRAEKQALARRLQRRDVLKKQSQHLDRELEATRLQAEALEREYHETVKRRAERAAERKEKQAQLDKYVNGLKDLQEQLVASREEWKKKLEVEYMSNDKSIEPIVLQASDLQDKVEKLLLKKDELARSIHPEMYAVTNVEAGLLRIPAPPAAGSSPGPPASVADGDAESDAEEAVFKGLPGLQEKRPEEASVAHVEGDAGKASAKRGPEEAGLPAEAGDGGEQAAKAAKGGGPEGEGEVAESAPDTGGSAPSQGEGGVVLPSLRDSQ